MSASVDWILLSPTPTHISLVISHECVTHAPHYRGQTNYRPGFTTLHIFGRAALCSSDVNTALLKLSPLPSCIPVAFGNTLKPLSHYFPANSSGYLFICNRISRNGGGNTAAAGRSLCTTNICLSESLQVRTPCHGNNPTSQAAGPEVTFSEDNANILWHLSVTQFCTRNCSNMSVKL